MQHFFCNECFYWWRTGGMVKPREYGCPECHSEDIVKKQLTTSEQEGFSDMREFRRRENLVATLVTTEPKKKKVFKSGFEERHKSFEHETPQVKTAGTKWWKK